MSFHCLAYGSAAEFLEAAEPSLLAHESEHNLLLGLANALKTGQREPQGSQFFSISQDRKFIGHALRSHSDRPLGLSRMPSQAALALARHVHARGIELHGTLGPQEVAEAFASEWERLSGQHARLAMHQGVYQLDQVIRPEPLDGELVPSQSVDPEIIRRFLIGFMQDCFPEDPDPITRAEESLTRQLRDGTLYLWKNAKGEITAMAARMRETRNSSTISLVYTPPEHRGKGYGSRITALVSELELKRGKKFCNLFTDLKNPTSNSIYQKIGYYKIGQSKHFEFIG